MNGMSYADAIIRQVMEEHGRRPDSRVVKVTVKVGDAVFQELDELYSAWDLLTRDSLLKGAELEVEVVGGRDCVLESVVFD